MQPEIITNYNKAVKLLENNKFEKAMSAFKKLPDFKEKLLNIANCCKYLDQDKKAFELYKLCNDSRIPFLNGSVCSDYTLAYSNLGLMHYMYERDEAALANYDKALELDPNFFNAAWNRSTCILRMACSGRSELFAEGWNTYDYRFKKTPPVVLKNDASWLMYWDKVDPNVSLAVLVEQGIGDTIMWGRYLDELSKRVKKLWIQCDPKVEPIFEGYNTFQQVSSTDASHAIPLCSIAGLFDHIPNEKWLKGTYNAREFPEGYNIGVVWSGSPGHVNNRHRSISMHRMHRFTKYGKLWSLSPDFSGTKQIGRLEINNWQDTIEYLLGLDLVISVDTSIVHMCGTLGVECWMIQPFKETDFRWGDSSMGLKNVWYDSVKVYRNYQDWEEVLDRVEKDLAERVYEY